MGCLISLLVAIFLGGLLISFALAGGNGAVAYCAGVILISLLSSLSALGSA